uniref:Large ribosomal subunit protein uL22c n=1 Tax=Gisekia pharnaceoides TaxID=3530 RepID=A0A411JRU0_GISPH|nr:ribosomal protein L22 [Gisekia pharnaceoides]QBC67807.1 ribosomal protein L22 [Gisekia pharnaceoides]
MIPLKRLKRKKRRDETYAVGQYISMSPDKARRVIDQIRGCSYEEAIRILDLMPYRACYPIFKLIYSAAANGVHHKRHNEDYLVIMKAEVNKGTTMKKLKPRARGRSYMIKRPTCHITIVLRDFSFYEDFKAYIKLVSGEERQKVLRDLQWDGYGADIYEAYHKY